MGFFDKKHESDTPIGNLRAHIGTYMYFVKVGKSKFKHKGRIGEIFADMDNTQFLFNQATMGTMYDFKKKLDYALWDAAVHKYTEDMEALKAELLKVVDQEEAAPKEEAPKEEEAVEVAPKEEETGDWKSSIKGQMAAAEEKAKKAAERKKREAEAEEGFAVDASEEMTEADCRELWRILQGLEREFQEMKSIADDWFTVHGKGNGCFAALAMMALIPVGAIYGICQML